MPWSPELGWRIYPYTNDLTQASSSATCKRYLIKYTGEVFNSEKRYEERLELYEKEIWNDIFSNNNGTTTTTTTGQNLSFKRALKSEKKSIHRQNKLTEYQQQNMLACLIVDLTMMVSEANSTMKSLLALGNPLYYGANTLSKIALTNLNIKSNNNIMLDNLIFSFVLYCCRRDKNSLKWNIRSHIRKIYQLNDTFYQTVFEKSSCLHFEIKKYLSKKVYDAIASSKEDVEIGSTEILPRIPPLCRLYNDILTSDQIVNLIEVCEFFNKFSAIIVKKCDFDQQIIDLYSASISYDHKIRLDNLIAELTANKDIYDQDDSSNETLFSFSRIVFFLMKIIFNRIFNFDDYSDIIRAEINTHRNLNTYYYTFLAKFKGGLQLNQCDLEPYFNVYSLTEFFGLMLTAILGHKMNEQENPQSSLFLDGYTRGSSSNSPQNYCQLATYTNAFTNKYPDFLDKLASELDYFNTMELSIKIDILQLLLDFVYLDMSLVKSVFDEYQKSCKNKLDESYSGKIISKSSNNINGKPQITNGKNKTNSSMKSQPIEKFFPNVSVSSTTNTINSIDHLDQILRDHYRDEAKKFFDGFAGGNIGSDRFYRNYWYFSCLPDVIIVETVKDEMSDSSNQWFDPFKVFYNCKCETVKILDKKSNNISSQRQMSICPREFLQKSLDSNYSMHECFDISLIYDRCDASIKLQSLIREKTDCVIHNYQMYRNHLKKIKKSQDHFWGVVYLDKSCLDSPTVTKGLDAKELADNFICDGLREGKLSKKLSSLSKFYAMANNNINSDNKYNMRKKDKLSLSNSAASDSSCIIIINVVDVVSSYNYALNIINDIRIELNSFNLLWNFSKKNVLCLFTVAGHLSFEEKCEIFSNLKNHILMICSIVDCKVVINKSQAHNFFNYSFNQLTYPTSNPKNIFDFNSDFNMNRFVESLELTATFAQLCLHLEILKSAITANNNRFNRLKCSKCRLSGQKPVCVCVECGSAYHPDCYPKGDNEQTLSNYHGYKLCRDCENERNSGTDSDTSRGNDSLEMDQPNVGVEKRCEICNVGGATLISCVRCSSCFHMDCTIPPIVRRTRAPWKCHRCIELPSEKIPLQKEVSSESGPCFTSISLEDSLNGQYHREYCNVCNDGGLLVCCDGCPRSFHLVCTQPPLQDIPEGAWFCNFCIAGPTRRSFAKKVK